MRLDRDEVIAGVPILAIRGLLRKLNWRIGLADVARVLTLDPAEARALVDELHLLGLIAPVNGEQDTWAPTPRGNALAGARALPPMTRKTAEALLEAFLRRVTELNTSNKYVYRVARVVVFGSYLSDSPTMNDLDLAVEFVPRETDPDRHFEACERHTQAARAAGRRFSGFVDQLGWPEEEVRRFLKARSPRISLHDMDELRKLRATARTVFGL